MSGNCRHSRHQWSSGTCQCCGAQQCVYERAGHRCQQMASGTEVRGVAKSPRYCAAHGYMLATGEPWAPRKTRHSRGKGMTIQ